MRNVPNILEDVPESVAPLTPEKALSISSHHIMQGATDSAVLITDLKFSSELPTIPENTRPMSSLNKGRDQNEAIALDILDLPAPWIPIIIKPLGFSGKP